MSSSYKASLSFVGDVESALEWNFSKVLEEEPFLAARALNGKSASDKKGRSFIAGNFKGESSKLTAPISTYDGRGTPPKLLCCLPANIRSTLILSKTSRFSQCLCTVAPTDHAFTKELNGLSTVLIVYARSLVKYG